MRLVATIEWLRLFPNEGLFPQIAQTFDIGPHDICTSETASPHVLAAFRSRPAAGARHASPGPGMPGPYIAEG